jgi:hypothetical protein
MDVLNYTESIHETTIHKWASWEINEKTRKTRKEDSFEHSQIAALRKVFRRWVGRGRITVKDTYDEKVYEILEKSYLSEKSNGAVRHCKCKKKQKISSCSNYYWKLSLIVDL